jgi:hypothetical protein
LPNETYSDYVARLTAAGYVGTVTEVDETTAVEGYGPSAVTKVLYTPSGSPQKVLDPLLWPSTDPNIADNQAITVRKNTTDADPATTDQPSGSDCSTCAINWVPIESLDVGTKFPFGVPAWVAGIFGGLTFADSCPTLSIGKPTALGGGSIDIPFCSTEWEDTYRPIVFPILEAVMTLAAVALLGVKIFGIGSGGDGD